jgi:hypothetical protein
MTHGQKQAHTAGAAHRRLSGDGVDRESVAEGGAIPRATKGVVGLTMASQHQ